MRVFSGFPDGKLDTVPVPQELFQELLPQIDSLEELKVTLHLLWRLSQQRGYARYVTRSDLMRDATLLKSVSGGSHEPEAAIQEGLAGAVARRSILAVDAPGGDQILVLNTERGRQLAQRFRQGKPLPAVPARPEESGREELPTIFALYERSIGLLQPMIADALREAERVYPFEWIEEAFREAVERNKRSWRYVETILQRWEREGRQDPRGSADDRSKYIQGRYADLFRRNDSDDTE